MSTFASAPFAPLRVHPDPVVRVGAPGAWDDGHIGDPDVQLIGDRYVMFYYGVQRESGLAGNGIAQSRDGIRFAKVEDNPVLWPDKGGWDARYAHKPRVIHAFGRYHMFYCGVDDSGNRTIGKATSTDLQHWHKWDGNPILPVQPGSAWHASAYDAPFVIAHDGRFYLFFSGSCPGMRAIGVMVSDDLEHWAHVSDNPVLAPAESGWDAGFIGSLHVMRHQGAFWGFYNAHDRMPAGLDDEPGRGAIGLVRSVDLVHWARYEGNPIIQPGPAGSWYDRVVWRPAPLLIGETLHLYFNAHGPTEQIGVATARWTG